MKKSTKYSIEHKKQIIAECLEFLKTEGNTISKFAKERNIKRPTIYDWMNKYERKNDTHLALTKAMSPSFIEIQKPIEIRSINKVTVNYYGATIDCEEYTLTSVLKALRMLND